MTNNIATYLKYANVQMAAEALFEFNPAKTTNIITPGSVASQGKNWREKLGSGLAKQHTI